MRRSRRLLNLFQGSKKRPGIARIFHLTSISLLDQLDMAPITSSDSLGITVLVLLVVFSVLTSLAVWGRFWSRSAKKVSPAANDHAILIALVRHQLSFSSISCIGSQMLLTRCLRGV